MTGRADPTAAPAHQRGLAYDPAAAGCAAGWDELALRFTIGLPGAPVAIAASRDPGRIAANLRAAARGPLPAEVMAVMRARWRACAAEGWPALN